MKKMSDKEWSEAVERLRALPMDVQRKLARAAVARVLAEEAEKELKKRAH